MFGPFMTSRVIHGGLCSQTPGVHTSLLETVLPTKGGCVRRRGTPTPWAGGGWYQAAGHVDEARARPGVLARGHQLRERLCGPASRRCKHHLRVLNLSEVPAGPDTLHHTLFCTSHCIGPLHRRSSICFSEKLLPRNVKRFRGGLVFRGHRLVYHQAGE